MIFELIIFGFGKMLYDTVTESNTKPDSDSDSDTASDDETSKPLDLAFPIECSKDSPYWQEQKRLHHLAQLNKKLQREQVAKYQRENLMRFLSPIPQQEILAPISYLSPIPKTPFEVLAERTENPLALARLVADHQKRMHHLSVQKDLTISAMNLLAVRPDLHRVRIRSGGMQGFFSRSDPHVWIDIDVE